MTSVDPLKTSLGLFGADKSGNAYASSVLDGADTLMLNKFPQGMQNAYITGMSGKWTPPAKVTIGGTSFPANAQVPWVVRWDFDPVSVALTVIGSHCTKSWPQVKGPHVNFVIGKGGSQTKVAVQSDLQGADPKVTMNNIVKNLNEQAGGYNMKQNMGKTEPEFPTSKEDSLNRLRDFFKSEATGPCG